MAQVIEDVVFLTPSSMKVKVVHEGDVFKVSKIKRDAQGYNVHCVITMVRELNNAAITRLKDDE